MTQRCGHTFGNIKTPFHYTIFHIPLHRHCERSLPHACSAMYRQCVYYINLYLALWGYVPGGADIFAVIKKSTPGERGIVPPVAMSTTSTAARQEWEHIKTVNQMYVCWYNILALRTYIGGSSYIFQATNMSQHWWYNYIFQATNMSQHWWYDLHISSYQYVTTLHIFMIWTTYFKLSIYPSILHIGGMNYAQTYYASKSFSCIASANYTLKKI